MCIRDRINYGKEKEETDKSFGKKGDKAVTTKQGHTYDKYRNVLTKKSPKAYLAKNKGKEHLYTTTYTYQTAQGYLAGDAAFVCPLVTEESYSGAGTKNKLVSTVSTRQAGGSCFPVPTFP